MAGEKSTGGLYKIKHISEIVGISPTLLRAWERRYDFLTPPRQSGGHRLYTEQDLNILRRVKELLAGGRSIGEVAALGRESLMGSSVAAYHMALEGDGESSQAASPEVEDIIRGLAPEDLPNTRSERFAGEELGVSLRELAPADLSTVHRLYQLVKGLYELWMYMDQHPLPDLLLARLQELSEPNFLSQISQLGAATRNPSPMVSFALEVCRQGAIGPLLECSRQPERLGEVILLARDQAKMMRNAFYDLDVPLREADESLKAHGVLPVVSKVEKIGWGGAEVHAWTGYRGPISSCCLETSTMDRVLYQFLNRSQGGEFLNMWVVPITPQMTRWVFETSSRERAPFSAADFSAVAVGYSVGVGGERAVSDRYVGTSEKAGREWSWFHWPTYEPPHDVPHCGCDPH